MTPSTDAKNFDWEPLLDQLIEATKRGLLFWKVSPVDNRQLQCDSRFGTLILRIDQAWRYLHVLTPGQLVAGATDSTKTPLVKNLWDVATNPDLETIVYNLMTELETKGMVGS